MNNAFNLDGTGLGWFCLFVVFAACFYSYWNFARTGALAGSDAAVGDLLGVLWATWAVLWFLFWLVLGLGKTALTVFTGAWCAAQGIYTGLIPALFLINIPSGVTTTFAVVIGAVSVISFIAFAVILKPKWSVAEATPTPAAYSGA